MQQAVACCDLFPVFFLGFQSRQCFLGRDSDAELLLQIGVATQLFLSRQHFCYGYVATLYCIIVISIATQKVCRDRVLPPLSLFPCCSFIFYVATWTFVLGMFCMSRPQYVMSRQHFSACSIFSCRDLIFLVATSLFCLQPVFVLRPIFLVAMGLFCVQLIYVSQPEDLCRDIKTPFQLEVCRNIDSPCYNQVSSSIKHPLSRLSFLVAP